MLLLKYLIGLMLVWMLLTQNQRMTNQTQMLSKEEWKFRGSGKLRESTDPKLSQTTTTLWVEWILRDQMTNLNKGKKKMHWYVRVFVKFILIACFKAYIMKGQVIDHNGRGKRKRDLLQLKQDLCIQVVADTLGKNSKRQRQNVPSLDQYLGREHVGVHLPVKGKGHNHHCIICERKCTEAKRRGQVISSHKTSYMCQHCSGYLCIGPPGKSCFVDYHSRLVYW